MRKSACFLALTMALVSSTLLRAPAEAGLNTWTTNWPEPASVAVGALAIAPTAPNTVYLSANSQAGWGFFKSTDAGVSFSTLNWTPTYASVDQIVVSTASTAIVYVRGSEGLAESTDGGGSWNGLTRPAPAYNQLEDFLVDPVNAGTLFAVMDQAGAYKSTDNGVSWTHLKPPSDEIKSLLFDPTTSSTLYATTNGGTTYIPCVSKGFKTTDGGTTWVDVTNANDQNILDGWIQCGNVGAWIINPFDHNTLLATATTTQALMRSTDAGRTWHPWSYLAWYIRHFFWDPLSPDTVYAAADQGILKSTDAGSTWNPAGAPPPSPWPAAPEALVFDALTPGYIYCLGSSSASLMKTTDRGTTWKDESEVNLDPVYDVTVSPSDPLLAYAQTARAVLSTTNGGQSWSKVPVDGLVGPVAIDPITTTTLYAGGSGYYHHGTSDIFKSTDGGATWSSLRFAWLPFDAIATIVIDPLAPENVFALVSSQVGQGGQYHSKNGGATWESSFFGRITVANGKPYSIAIDPFAASTLYATVPTAGGSLFRGNILLSGQADWNWNTPISTGLSEQQSALQIVCDSLASGTLWLGTTAGLLWSADGGVHWITKGPRDDIIRSVVIWAGPLKTIYAGTDSAGVFTSTDEGESWQPINAGFSARLPIIHRLAISSRGTELYAATNAGVFSYAMTPVCAQTGPCIKAVAQPPVTPVIGR